MRIKRNQIFTGLGLITLLVLMAGSLQASVVGEVTKTEGTPEVLRTTSNDWAPIKTGDEVSVGDQLRTRAATKMEIKLQDGSVLILGENTLVTVDEQTLRSSGQNTSVFGLLLGKLRAVVADRYKDPGSRFEVRTPTAVAGVRGTEFIAEANADSSKFYGIESQTLVEGRKFINCDRFKGCGS